MMTTTATKTLPKKFFRKDSRKATIYETVRDRAGVTKQEVSESYPHSDWVRTDINLMIREGILRFEKHGHDSARLFVAREVEIR